PRRAGIDVWLAFRRLLTHTQHAGNIGQPDAVLESRWLASSDILKRRAEQCRLNFSSVLCLCQRRGAVTRFLTLCPAAVLAFEGSYASPAEARTKWGNCYWDGTSPFCAGSCRPGFSVRATKACFSGYKVKCCEPMGSTTQR